MPHDHSHQGHSHHGHSHHGHDHHHGGHRDHHHGPGGHSHAPKDFGRAFAIGAGLNIAFVAAEAIAGLVTGSLALLADAGHNLSDVLGLLMAWGAVVLSRRAPAGRRTYGLGKGTVLASLGNAGLLLLAVGAIVWEAVRRFGDPQPIEPGPVIIVAAIGVVINTATALMFMHGRHEDLNRRGVFLHMAADAAISLGVVLAGCLMLWTGWLWLDAAASLVIVAIITAGTWGLLKDAIAMALHAVPPGIDPAAVSDYLGKLPGVAALHDLHIWGMSTAETAMTVHLVMPGSRPDDAFYADVSHELRQRFGIHHCTVQVERGDSDVACQLAPEDVV